MAHHYFLECGGGTWTTFSRSSKEETKKDYWTELLNFWKRKWRKVTVLGPQAEKEWENIVFSVYRKPTNVPRYIPSDSHCPISHEHAAFISMVYRLCKLPLNAKDYMDECNYTKQVALLNGFNVGIIEKIRHRHSKRINRANVTTLQTQTPAEIKQLIRLQFAVLKT